MQGNEIRHSGHADEADPLTGIHTMAFVDRGIIAPVNDPLEQALHLTDRASGGPIYSGPGTMGA